MIWRCESTEHYLQRPGNLIEKVSPQSKELISNEKKSSNPQRKSEVYIKDLARCKMNRNKIANSLVKKSNKSKFSKEFSM